MLQPRLAKFLPELFPGMGLFKFRLPYPVEHIGIFPVVVDCCPAAVDIPPVVPGAQLYL